MPHIFETTNKDVERLGALDLTKLLKCLLSLEAEAHGIPRSCIHGSLQINAADAGEDASIEWQGGPDSTEWIPNRNTLFQSKATNTGPTACAAEVLTPDGSEVKQRVDEVLTAGGAYVLFCTTSCNRRMSNDRIRAIREALRGQKKAYADTAQIHIYDANTISDWANTAVPAVAMVRTAAGAHLPAALKTWSEWQSYPEFQGPFISDPELDDTVAALRTHLAGSRAVARILGLSGVGKTRIALEAFRPPSGPASDPDTLALSQGCVYVDAASSPESIPSIIAEWVRQHLRGTVVVDNCDAASHKQLKREVGRTESNLSLLTLDYTIEPHSNDHPYVEIAQVSDDVIKGIVQHAYPNFSDTDVSRIVNFAQGFPQIAVLIADAHLDREPDIANLKDQDLIDRLLWQRGQPDPVARGVIQACSLFTHLGHEDNVAEQREFVAERICKMDKDEFYRHVEAFRTHRIVDKRNRFIRVVPLPLAITLAAQWWEGCSPERARDLFLSPMPDGMAETLCDQLAKLDFVPRAREIVADLCGENGPFGLAEVLLSEQGSRLFRSIVEVNPEPCLNALQRAIGDWSREKLLELGPARRNFVWALEKLCFWTETFPGAARMMLALAAAENESWGNNATNQFLQLFHLHLSGTQAPPPERVAVVDEAWASGCSERRRLAVRALGSALEMHHFSRTGGVEQQGSRAPSRDWEPKLWAEVFDYQDACVQRLVPIACGEDVELASLARKEFGESLRGLIMRSRNETLDAAIREIAAVTRGFWPEALHTLRHALEYKGPQMPPEIRKAVEAWVDLLQPSGIEERLRLLVSVPDYEHRKEEDEHYTDVAAERAQSLARELPGTLDELIKHLPLLLSGEQRQAYTFGRELAQCVENSLGFATDVLAALASVPEAGGNPSLLCGFLAGQSDRAVVTRVLEDASADQTLIPYLVELTRLSRPTPEDLRRVLDHVREGRIPVVQMYAFAVNSVVDHLESPEVVSFCDQLAEMGVPGVGCAFEILFMYCFRDKDRHTACRPAFRRYLMTPGLIAEIGKNPTFRGHGWEQTTMGFLSPPENDPPLAESIANDIVAACAEKEFSYDARYYVSKVLTVLLQHYFDVAWPPLGTALLGDNWHQGHYLNYLLAGDWDKTKSDAILAAAPASSLLTWCQEHSPEAARSVSRCLPILQREEGKEHATWHPIARAFIDTFGDDEQFLSGVSGNLHTFSWSGSVVPYYEMQVQLMQELTSHKFPQVQKWAQSNIQWLNEQIAQELKKEEEHDLGIY